MYKICVKLVCAATENLTFSFFFYCTCTFLWALLHFGRRFNTIIFFSCCLCCSIQMGNNFVVHLKTSALAFFEWNGMEWVHGSCIGIGIEFGGGVPYLLVLVFVVVLVLFAGWRAIDSNGVLLSPAGPHRSSQSWVAVRACVWQTVFWIFSAARPVGPPHYICLAMHPTATKRK